MYLKRLEIEGFKSFASNVAFEFGAGITAIVGPNGCGKSNAADALRWVLGEQSGKQLRARKLEDVIFAGSARHPQAATAEVRLVLDNNDGWLPVDTPEVRIDRKAYRSGESAYLINRRRSRLKDVSDLFLRARTGQNSFAIMGQGLVETILNFRPEERRLLLEEVADLQGFRLQLEEAQQRLSATSENEARASLVLNEIAPSLAQLERQAAKSLKRVAIEAELKTSLRTWYAKAWQDSQEGLAYAQAILEQALERFKEAEVSYRQRENRSTEVRHSLEDWRAEEAQRSLRLTMVRERQTLLEEQIKLDSVHHSLLTARSNDILNELTALENERQRLAQALAESEEQSEASRQAIASAGEAIAVLEEQLAPIEQEMIELRAQAQAADAALVDTKMALAAAESRLEAWLENERRRQKATPAEVVRLNLLIAHLVSIAKEYAGLRAQERTLLEERAILIERGQATGRIVEEQHNRLEARRQRLHELLLQLERARGHLEAIREELQPALPSPEESAEMLPAVQEPITPPAVYYQRPATAWGRLLDFIAGILSRSGDKALVELDTTYSSAEAVKLSDVPGGLATFAELIQVPAGLERAIAAALADKADALLVQNQRDALAVAEHIAQHGKAKTVLVSVDDVPTIYPPNLLKEPGVIGIAATLVRCPEDYRYLVNAMLGRIVIVENVQVAQRVLRRGMGSVVTRDGIVLHPTGVVESGRGSPIIQQRRELTTLPRRIRRLEQQRVNLEGEIHTLTTSISQREDDLETIRQRLMYIDRTYNKLRGELVSCRQQLGRNQGEIRQILGAQRVDGNEEAANAATHVRLEKERNRLADALAAAEPTVRNEYEALSAVTERRDALAQELALAKAEAAALRNHQASAQTLKHNYREMLGNIDTQIEKKQSQQQALSEEIAALDARLAGRQKAAAELSKWLARNEAKSSHQVDLARLEREMEEAEAELASAHSDLLAAERQHLEAEAALQRHEDQLALLRSRLIEDGLVVNENGEVASPEEDVKIPEWLSSRPAYEEATYDHEAQRRRIEQLKTERRSLGDVNPQAEEDYMRVKARHDFLTTQMADLASSERVLKRAIEELQRAMAERFEAVFKQVGEEFQLYFITFFGGGYAKLILTPPEDYKSSGVDIIAQPPGKNLQNLNALSSGEKALTAIALLFALLQTRPSPFCVLDEVDAALDEANVGRFVKALQQLSTKTQFIVITHNRRTMEAADRIYGIAMGTDGASKILSLQLATAKAG
jgi:chromosome segregation protein